VTERQIVPLDPTHVRSTFNCGIQSLNEFLHTRVNPYGRRGLGKTFVIAEAPKNNVIGYYTLAAGDVEVDNLQPEDARRLPRHPVPVVLLARMAVHQDFQKIGLGRLLLRDAINRAVLISRDIGIHAVEVEAIDDRAAMFYRKFGFVTHQSEPLDLYLPLSTITHTLKPL
jgi:GNAT superfamily N-acetyltransferase